MNNFKIQKRRELQKILARSFFAHHPNCPQYAHHVFNLGTWRFCVGCSGLYSGIFVFLIIDLLFLNTSILIPSFRFFIGLVLFIPALIQLKWKSKIKTFKFLMRLSLGFSTYMFLSFIYLTSNIALKAIYLIIFVSGVYLYNKSQSSKQLMECESCKFDEDYDTCTIRFSDILAIEDLEILKDDFYEVAFVLSLKYNKFQQKIINKETYGRIN